jgi:hypothetical protein
LSPLVWDASTLESEVVDPVVSAMLSDEERANSRTELRAESDGGWTLFMFFPKDTFQSYVYQVPQMEGWSARQVAHYLADQLQDFIAESSFGWGEQRPIPPELHDPPGSM